MNDQAKAKPCWIKTLKRRKRRVGKYTLEWVLKEEHIDGVTRENAYLLIYDSTPALIGNQVWHSFNDNHPICKRFETLTEQQIAAWLERRELTE